MFACAQLCFVHVARQLRSDLSFNNGCVHGCKQKPEVLDLLRLKSAVDQARKGADTAGCDSGAMSICFLEWSCI